MVTHRRSWLRQRTDASPHTNYLFQFLKSAASSRRCRCAVARQKRNFKLLRSFRQPPRFHFEVSAATRTSFFATRFSTGIRCEGGASYCLVSGRQAPRNFLFFEVLAAGRISFSAARFTTGARCEGGASYCLVTGRQHPSWVFFRRAFRSIDPANCDAARDLCFAAAA